MSRFTELQKMKQCPLCLKKWHLLEEKGKTGKVYFFCNDCKIILWVRDVFLGRWEEFADVPCPTCGHARMKFFCREDTFCKWLCPKCKTTLENYEPDLHPKALELRKLQELAKGGKVPFKVSAGQQADDRIIKLK